MRAFAEAPEIVGGRVAEAERAAIAQLDAASLPVPTTQFGPSSAYDGGGGEGGSGGGDGGDGGGREGGRFGPSSAYHAGREGGGGGGGGGEGGCGESGGGEGGGGEGALLLPVGSRVAAFLRRNPTALAAALCRAGLLRRRAPQIEAEGAPQIEAERAPQIEAERPRALQIESERALQIDAERAPELESERAPELESERAAQLLLCSLFGNRWRAADALAFEAFAREICRLYLTGAGGAVAGVVVAGAEPGTGAGGSGGGGGGGGTMVGATSDSEALADVFGGIWPSPAAAAATSSCTNADDMLTSTGYSPPQHSSRHGPQHTQHTASTAATPRYPQALPALDTSAPLTPPAVTPSHHHTPFLLNTSAPRTATAATPSHHHTPSLLGDGFVPQLLAAYLRTIPGGAAWLQLALGRLLEQLTSEDESPDLANATYPPGMASAAYPPGMASATYPPGMARGAYPPGMASGAYPPGMANGAYPPGISAPDGTGASDSGRTALRADSGSGGTYSTPHSSPAAGSRASPQHQTPPPPSPPPPLCLLTDPAHAYRSLPPVFKAEVDEDVSAGAVASLCEHPHVVAVLSARAGALGSVCEVRYEPV